MKKFQGFIALDNRRMDVHVNANDYWDAVRLIHAQYGVSPQLVKEIPDRGSDHNSGAENIGGILDVFRIVVGLLAITSIITICLPLLIMLAYPVVHSWYYLRSYGLHAAYVVLGTGAATVAIICVGILVLVHLPRWFLALFGLVLYGWAGYVGAELFKVDHEWRIVAAIIFSLIGLGVLSGLGQWVRKAMRGDREGDERHEDQPALDEDSSDDEEGLEFEDDDQVSDQVRIVRALETLGLDETASAAAIKRQYRELLKRYHPDLNGGNRSFEKLVGQITIARNTLKEAGLTN